MTQENDHHPTSRYICPIVSKEVRIPCTVRTCMYYDGNKSVKGCRYAAVQSALHKEVLSKEMKKKTACSLYSIDEEDLRVAVRRVMSVLLANEFFNFLYDKPITEARPKELAFLSSSEGEEKFNLWRPSAKKIAFADLVLTLDFLKNNLK